MPVVTLSPAGGPSSAIIYGHPIAWTEALAQFGHGRATARIHGVSGSE
ncbi:hypothetical protein ABZS88_24560 [Streptomyces sp. NPDC005480]|jgi:hypothetical protein